MRVMYPNGIRCQGIDQESLLCKRVALHSRMGLDVSRNLTFQKDGEDSAARARSPGGRSSFRSDKWTSRSILPQRLWFYHRALHRRCVARRHDQFIRVVRPVKAQWVVVGGVNGLNNAERVVTECGTHADRFVHVEL